MDRNVQNIYKTYFCDGLDDRTYCEYNMEPEDLDFNELLTNLDGLSRKEQMFLKHFHSYEKNCTFDEWKIKYVKVCGCGKNVIRYEEDSWACDYCDGASCDKCYCLLCEKCNNSNCSCNAKPYSVCIKCFKNRPKGKWRSFYNKFTDSETSMFISD